MNHIVSLSREELRIIDAVIRESLQKNHSFDNEMKSRIIRLKLMDFLLDGEENLTSLLISVGKTTVIGGEVEQWKLQNLLKLDIAEIGLSYRSSHALAHAGITRVEELLPHTPKSLKMLEGIGTKCVTEVWEFLKAAGLSTSKYTSSQWHEAVDNSRYYQSGNLTG